MPEEKNKVNAERILNDLAKAYSYKAKWLTAANEDMEFSLGKQWETKDVNTLFDRGVRALTINKIKPIILLLTGTESQNRTDFMAYPEGDEDNLKAEVSTRLLKNILKNSGSTGGDYTISEMFEESVCVGESFIEPYIDYTYDLLNGEFQLQKVDGTCLYPAPGCKKYDLSDAKYVVKLTVDKTQDDIIGMFPEKQEKIKGMFKGSRLDLELLVRASQTGLAEEFSTYPKSYEQRSDTPGAAEIEEPLYDLVEYYYKVYKKKYLVLDKIAGKISEPLDDKKGAEEYIAFVNKRNNDMVADLIERSLPEIRKVSLIGSEILEDDVCWTWPRWRGYPFFPCYAYKSTWPIKEVEFKVQGIVRGIKDLNRELNKRRTQELHHLNSSANSGWISEEGSWVDKNIVKNFGSSPGAILEYKKGRPKPEKIEPARLSQGHAQLAAENTQDIKEASGINADLLAMNEKQASGKAIYLRQRSGMVMVQKIFDNLSQTKKLIGRFILTQLGELYTVEKAMAVVGEKFIKDNFSRPVMKPGNSGEMVPELDPVTKEIKKEVEPQAVNDFFTTLLNDMELGKYNVAIGESASNETIKLANYLMLLEMAKEGIPIPPDVLIDESNLSESSKEKVKRYIEASRASAANAGTQQ
jgi:hypothetical protein